MRSIWNIVFNGFHNAKVFVCIILLYVLSYYVSMIIKVDKKVIDSLK